MKKLILSLMLFTVLLYSCSNSDEVNSVKTENVVVGNDSQEDRITFYGSPTARAVEDFPSVGTEPTLPNYPSFKSPNEANVKNYILEGGQGQINMSNGEVYITGNVKTHNIHGDGIIYVMPTGKLTLSSGFNNQSTRIVVFGDIETEDGINLGTNGEILVEKDFTINGDLNISGTVVCKGELTITGKIQFNGGKVKGKCIDVQTDSDRAVDMSGGGELAVRSYLACSNLYMGNTATVYMYPNSMIQVSNLTTMTSNTCGFRYYSSEDKVAPALLNTEKFHVEGSADNPEYVGGLFNKNLKIKYSTLENCNPAFVDKFIPSATDYYIPKDGCNPGNGNKNDKPFTPIALIESPEHAHTHLSATCVQAENNLAYVSYHLNEEYEDNFEYKQHMGCVEIWKVTEVNAQILSWLMNDWFDFNHLIVYNNKVYTIGDTDSGSTIGIATVNNNTFGTEMEYKSLTEGGLSGNCIIRDGNFFRVASYKGFQSLDDNLNAQADFIATPGSAKHIAKSNGYIVTLNLDSKKDESTGTVTVYNGSDSYSFQTKTIKPTDGKNVISTDGQYIYVALGENGVAKYSMTGNLEGEYSWIAEKLETKPDYKGKPCANGLFVDNEYIYVANGAAGMIVLDKNTMKRVARYSRKSEMYSANYVQKVGDLIYIAYGRHGLEVVKMN